MVQVKEAVTGPRSVAAFSIMCTMVLDVKHFIAKNVLVG